MAMCTLWQAARSSIISVAIRNSLSAIGHSATKPGSQVEAALIGKVVSVSVPTGRLLTRCYLFYTGRPGKISSSKAVCTGRGPSHCTYVRAS